MSRTPLKSIIACLAVFLAALNAFAVDWHWANPFPHGNDVADIISFNGLVIQVTDSGQIYTSSDLVFWTPSDTGITNDLQGAAILGNQLIVTGSSGIALRSTDGVNYTYTNVNTSNWLVAVTASSNLAVAVGDRAAIYTTPDGANWTKQAKPPGVGSDWLMGSAYGDGLFVTVGDAGYVATSTNGINWTKRASGASGDLTFVQWVNTPGGSNGFTAPAFLAVSDAGEVITSSNGINWSFAPNYTTTTNSLYTAVGNDDSRLIAGDQQADLERLISGDYKWYSQTGDLLGDAPSWTYFCGLWQTNVGNSYLISGQDGFSVSGGELAGVYGWTPLDDSNRSWLWEMTTNAGLYIAVGANDTVMTSDDGVNWTTEAIPFTNGVSPTNTTLFGVGGDTNNLLVVGNRGTIVLSTNLFIAVVTTNANGSLETNNVSTIGVVWNPEPPPTTNDLQAVAAFDGNYYVAGGVGTILQSPDGSTWSPQTTSTQAYLSGLAVFSNTLVAVGENGTILTSANGTTWKSRASGTTNWIFRVRDYGGKLIAVGENGTILTSSNATTWTKRVSGTTIWLNDVTMVTNTYFIVGDAGEMLASTNATTWTNLNIITEQSLFGAATQNGQLVVAGDNGVILQSRIAPAVTQLQFLDFEITNNTALFLVASTNLAVDLQFTVDSSTNLLNWNTGPVIDMISGPLLLYENVPTNAADGQYFRVTLQQ